MRKAPIGCQGVGRVGNDDDLVPGGLLSPGLVSLRARCSESTLSRLWRRPQRLRPSPRSSGPRACTWRSAIPAAGPARWWPVNAGACAISVAMVMVVATAITVLIARRAARPARTYLLTTSVLVALSLLAPLSAASTSAATKLTRSPRTCSPPRSSCPWSAGYFPATAKRTWRSAIDTDRLISRVLLAPAGPATHAILALSRRSARLSRPAN